MGDTEQRQEGANENKSQQGAERTKDKLEHLEEIEGCRQPFRGQCYLFLSVFK